MLELELGPGRRVRPGPASPTGLEAKSSRVQAPLDEGVGLEFPVRGSRCDVQLWAVQSAACDALLDGDAPDPPVLAGRQLRVPAA